MTTLPAPTVFAARLGCSLDLPRIIVTAYDFDGDVTTLVGSVAVLEFGSGFGSAPKLTIRSDETPGAPAIFDWAPTATEGTLDVRLSPEQVGTIGAGTWTGVLKIEGPDAGDVQHNVREMTIPVEVVRWPVAVE